MLRKLLVVILFSLAFFSRPVLAASQCSTFQTSNLNFVNYIGNTVQTTSTITVRCAAGVAYSVGLNSGVYGSSVTNRQMRGGTGNAFFLGYQLFSDPARTVNWGNSAGTWVNGVGTGVNQSLTIYFQVPGNQVVGSGGYSDTIIASLYDNGATTNSQFNLTGTVQPYCAVSATDLQFGNYSRSLINSTSTITAGCSSGTSYNIGLNAGTAPGATVTTRSMTGPGGALLHYGLFRDSARALNWGNTVGTDTVAQTATGNPQTFTVYGQVPGGQDVASGAYSDTIIVTMTY